MNPKLYPAMAKKARGLKRREQVLAGIWAGKSTKEIGVDLEISAKTVEYHRGQLYRLFGVQDPVSLCRRGLAVGLLDAEDNTNKRRRRR